MAKRIVAFFACSFLSVALTIPALAQETAGRVVEIDQANAMLRLEDGSIYLLPPEFDYAAVEPGMEVYVIYDETES
ncbi:DUF1344 domain-containing protein [Consotaella aegiceratis]|uniref:DUF1344 domain-containing protein n=1 Tax=Consotaella aegiceratis TaxID=3097961 RepID=UPI002F41ED93